jgi:hypothetical protein
MRNRLILITTLFGVLLALNSCQKNLSTEKLPNAITGSWTFVSLSAQTVSRESYTNVSGTVATVTDVNYTTIDNTRSMVITPDSIISKDVGYTVDTVAVGYYYVNNLLVDSISLPFYFPVPPSSNSASYQLVGKDSIYFNNGNPFVGSTASSSNSGAHYSLSGNLLVLTSVVLSTATDNSAGFPIPVTDVAHVTITLRKQ